MSISNYIKTIGRGKQGARALNREQAEDLMRQVLSGRLTDLEMGAFVIAMRIKGETADELMGFMAAAHEVCVPLEPRQTAVFLPSYNGARKLPNLTPLLAMLLARRGVEVLVHGPSQGFGRVGTEEVFRALDLPVANDAAGVRSAWASGSPVYLPVDKLCPPLARLLDVRKVVGLRNSGHTMAKVLSPCAAGTSFRVVNYTHPEYATLLDEFLTLDSADALVMRGTEGEPVADLRRMTALEVFLGGCRRPELSRAGQTGSLTSVPTFPESINATATAQFTRGLLNGSAGEIPEPLAVQLDCLVAALKAMQTRLE